MGNDEEQLAEEQLDEFLDELMDLQVKLGYLVRWVREDDGVELVSQTPKAVASMDQGVAAFTSALDKDIEDYELYGRVPEQVGPELYDSNDMKTPVEMKAEWKAAVCRGMPIVPRQQPKPDIFQEQLKNLKAKGVKGMSPAEIKAKFNLVDDEPLTPEILQRAYGGREPTPAELAEDEDIRKDAGTTIWACFRSYMNKLKAQAN